MRILRPWLVASAAGLSLGTLLLEISPDRQPEENSYAETAPRAATYDAGASGSFVPDPFAPTASLGAPPDGPAPAPASQESDAPVQVASPAAREPDAP